VREEGQLKLVVVVVAGGICVDPGAGAGVANMRLMVLGMCEKRTQVGRVHCKCFFAIP